MTKSPRSSTWITVGAGGGARPISVPEAHPERPWNFEGLKVETFDSVGMPSCQLVVASLADAAGLQVALPGDEPFRWVELQGVDMAHLAVLRCVDDGADPSAPLEPIEEDRNPFTGEVVRRTVFHRSLETFEALVDGKFVSAKKVMQLAMDGDAPDALVLRLAPAFVARMARMSEATMTEVGSHWARAWSALAETSRRGSRPLSEDDARRGLDVLVSAAKLAIAGKQELFLWTAA